jgi:hypothetical protein
MKLPTEADFWALFMPFALGFLLAYAVGGFVHAITMGTIR